MAIPLSSIGIKVSYGFESVAKEGYGSLSFTKLPQVKSIPEMNPSPDTIETSSFDNLEYKTFINGLKDLGGVLGLTANYTEELRSLWAGIMTTWNTAKTQDKAMYLCFDIPGISTAVYLQVEPSPLGLPPAETNALLEITLNVTPVGEPTEDTKPTYTGTTTYNVTFSGYVENGVSISVFKDNSLVKDATTESTSTIVKLPDGEYTAVAKKSGSTTQVQDFTISGADTTVNFNSFA